MKVYEKVWGEYLRAKSKNERIAILKKHQILYPFRNYPGFYQLLDSYLQDLIEVCRGDNNYEEGADVSES